MPKRRAQSVLEVESFGCLHWRQSALGATEMPGEYRCRDLALFDQPLCEPEDKAYLFAFFRQETTTIQKALPSVNQRVDQFECVLSL